MDLLKYIGLFLFAYLLGSLPFSIWLTRWKTGKDVRESGSRHATATNTIRQAGWFIGGLVLFLDIGKGFIPVYVARQLAVPGWVIMLTAVTAVIGHCWPIFAGFRGGMGLATCSGAMLAISPLVFLFGLGILITFMLVMKHAARAVVISAIAIPPVLWLVGFSELVLMVSVGLAVVIGLRFLIDWRRKYRELWLDRETPAE